MLSAVAALLGVIVLCNLAIACMQPSFGLFIVYIGAAVLNLGLFLHALH